MIAVALCLYPVSAFSLWFLGFVALSIWMSGITFFWCLCAAAGNADEQKGYK